VNPRPFDTRQMKMQAQTLAHGATGRQTADADEDFYERLKRAHGKSAANWAAPK
jgi:hypothetical protein